jgi:hypothetical protein
VLEKDGADQFARSCDKGILHTVGEDKNILRTIIRRKDKWIGDILLRQCLLKYVTKGKIEGRIHVTERWGRTRTQLLDDLKKMRG